MLCDAAIIGAGPYGLAAASYLRQVSRLRQRRSRPGPRGIRPDPLFHRKTRLLISWRFAIDDAF